MREVWRALPGRLSAGHVWVRKAASRLLGHAFADKATGAGCYPSRVPCVTMHGRLLRQTYAAKGGCCLHRGLPFLLFTTLQRSECSSLGQPKERRAVHLPCRLCRQPAAGTCLISEVLLDMPLWGCSSGP